MYNILINRIFEDPNKKNINKFLNFLFITNELHNINNIIDEIPEGYYNFILNNIMDEVIKTNQDLKLYLLDELNLNISNSQELRNLIKGGAYCEFNDSFILESL